jgi:hypothetical protein
MICEEHWKIFDQQQHAWLSQFKLINWNLYWEDEMTERTPQTVTSKDFRSLDSRFIFQGGSHFANQIADIIDELTALRQQLAEALTNTGKMK